MKRIPILLFALISAIVCAPNTHAQRLTEQARLTTPRYFASATLLQDGNILLVGGRTSQGIIERSCELFDPLTNTSTSAGTIGVSRFAPSSVLLKDGRVLVSGGKNNSNSLLGSHSTCEIFNSLTNTWVFTGAMNYPRYAHTLTLLTNGKVLAIGGIGNGTSLSTCELFDPETGTWTLTNPIPNRAHNSHTAVLLPNGDVLVTDGYSTSGGLVQRCFLFHPQTNTWTETGSLTTQASGDHTLTLLPNGKVLLAGGWPTSLDRCELYDPTTGKWRQTGSLNRKRTITTTVLLTNGEVLAVGGYDSKGSDQTEFSLSSCEIYSPTTERWRVTSSLPHPIEGHATLITPTGRVLILAGGRRDTVGFQNGPNAVFNTVYAFNNEQNSVSNTNSLTKERTGHTLTLLPNGKTIAVGGSANCDNTQTLNSCELYNFSSKTWSTAAPLHQARTLHTTTLLPNGKTIAVGGRTSTDALTSTETYNFTTNSWTQTASLATARFHHTATLLADGSLLVIGGTQGQGTDEKTWDGLASCERYIPSLQRWEAATPISTKRFGHTATLLPNGNVLVVGGYNTDNIFLASTEIYNPQLNTWTTAAPITTARTFHTATLLPNGKVLITGGKSGNGALATAELYDYKTNTWTNAISFPQARYQHTATLLHNGDVLLTGGATLSSTNSQPVALATSALYDFATNTWSTTQDLPVSRTASKAILLPDNTVLLSGGMTTTPCTVSSSCFIYDVGLGYKQQDRPTITTLSPTKITDISGTGYIALTIQGTGFQDGNRSGSEASNGNYFNSSTNYPIVEIRRISGSQSDNDFVRYVPFDVGKFQWSNTATQVRIDKKLLQEHAVPAGYYRLTVIANGIPSIPAYFSIEPSAKEPTFQNAYTPVTSITHKNCTTELTVENAEAFSPNDKVLIIQMQGAEIDTTESVSYGTLRSVEQAGNFEFARISSIQNAIITLQAPLLQNYNVQVKVQLIKVPEYQTLTLSSTTTCPAWDGKTGGVLVISAAESLVLNADIDVSGKGFRGGIAVDADNVPNFQVPYYRDTDNPSFCAKKGEGVAGYGILPFTSGRGAPANGGGGGNNHNAGGGGGSNSTCGGNGGWAYNGNGAYSGNPADAQGLGGHPLAPANGRVFMGGGGGAGHGNNNQASQLGGTSGGNGGGIIIIETKTLVANNHTLRANGSSSDATEADGTGGGGAGGSILLDVDTYANNVAVSALGGHGGNIRYSGVGPGGGGSGGIVYLVQSSQPSEVNVQTDGGKAGKTSDRLYGNTNGCDGKQLFGLRIVMNTKAGGLSVQALPDTTLCLGSSVQLRTAIGEYTGELTYQWSPTTGLDNPTAATPLATPNQTTSYTVIVRDGAGCTASSSVAIAVKQCDPIECNTISGVINSYSKVLSLSPQSRSLVVAEPQLFSVGNQVLLIQMQGAQIATSNTIEYGTVSNLQGAGNYEFATIATIRKDTVYLSAPFAYNTYNTNGHIQLVKVPEYNHVTVVDTLTCPPWDGHKGGIIALSANCLTMESDISASGKGFRGAEYKDEPGSVTYGHSWEYVSDNSYYWGPKGEGIAGYGIAPFLYGKGSPANGGGGGNNHNAGGGGGAHYNDGGNGGFGYQGVPGDTHIPQGMGGKGLGKWQGNNSQRLFMGGGGGSGHANHAHGSRGANGGGIIVVRANTVRNLNNNRISARGADAPHDTSFTNPDGCGGGGAGGTVVLDVTQTDGVLPLDVTGGNGGSRLYTVISAGTGGGGAGGVILSTKDTTTIALHPLLQGGKAGTEPSGRPYGATDGREGILLRSSITGHFNRIALSECKGCVPVQRVQQQDCGKTSLMVEDNGYPITSIWLVGAQSSNVVLATTGTLPSMGTQTTIALINPTELGKYTIVVRNANNREISLTGKVLPFPLKPVISGNSKELTSSSAFSYQWNYNGIPLPNSKKQSFAPTLEGSYTVTAANENGCRTTSDPFIITFTDIPVSGENSQPALYLYPNPVHEELVIALQGFSSQQIKSIEICNILGVVVKTVDVQTLPEELSITLSLDGLPMGSYYAAIRLQNQRFVKKFIKN